MPHGHDDANWEAAKSEAKELLSERARIRGMVAYSDLVARIESLTFRPNDFAFFSFLGEISTEEDAAGRGMMTALVVHKDGDMEPGPGFYELAQQLGRDTSDIESCWVSELHRVHRAWSDA